MLPWDRDWLIRMRQAGSTGSKWIALVRFGGTATTRGARPGADAVGLDLDAVVRPADRGAQGRQDHPSPSRSASRSEISCEPPTTR